MYYLNEVLKISVSHEFFVIITLVLILLIFMFQAKKAKAELLLEREKTNRILLLRKSDRK